MALPTIRKPLTLSQSLDQKAAKLGATKAKALAAVDYHQGQAIGAAATAETAAAHEEAVAKAKAILDDAGVAL